jgi:uncharacterized protein YcnI
MRKLLSSLTLIIAVIATLPAVAFAHVVVTPAKAGIGERTTFNISVPNEKQVNVTGLRLAIPAGLDDVSPTVHPGWTITTTKDDGGNVTEISWTGGAIPAGQRDDFTFRAQTPADKTSLNWKAYQTYADGTIVAWDQKPGGAESESGNSGPYSVTRIADDLSTDSTDKSSPSTSSTLLPLIISLAALALSVVALTSRRR